MKGFPEIISYFHYQRHIATSLLKQMEAELYSSTQLADFAKIKEELLCGLVTHAEQAM